MTRNSCASTPTRELKAGPSRPTASPARKFRAGLLLPWTCPPYGYAVDPERPRDPRGVRVDDAAAEVVRAIFARYADEPGTLYGLARWLERREVPRPTGKPRWGSSTLRGILTNPAYTGQVFAGRHRTRAARRRRAATRPVGRKGQSPEALPPDAWIPVARVPALVDPACFDRAQAKLRRNQARSPRNNTAHPYLLRALVSCGRCGMARVGRASAARWSD